MFDLEIVNAFSTGAVNILKNYCNATVEKGAVVVKRAISPIMGIGIFVGVTGDVDGRILLSMSRETAFTLVSVLNEEQINAIDDIFVGTVKEFVNMVVGVAINELSTQNVSLDMTPPTLIIGDHMMMAEKASEAILCVNYLTNMGSIGLNMIFSE